MGRRIYTEEKAKVVAAVRGTEFNQFLFAQAILHQDDLNNRINSSFSSYHPGAIHPFLLIILVQNILFFISSWWKTPSAASNWINSVPQIAATTFAFSSVFILLLWVYCIVYIGWPCTWLCPCAQRPWSQRRCCSRCWWWWSCTSIYACHLQYSELGSMTS